MTNLTAAAFAAIRIHRNQSAVSTPVDDRAPTLDELSEYAARIQIAINEYHDQQGYTHGRPTISVMPGRKFARIVKTEPGGHSRSVYGFVSRETGRLYKAASWKAPARNFTRGSMFDTARDVSPWGVS